MTTLTINSTDDLQTALHDSEHVYIRGKGSKTALQRDDCTVLDLSALSGIIEYQPDEYTFTAHAATPVRAIQQALSEHGQYLPCDPMLADKATLGGTIATNLSGSRRFRYGGVRDFLLGATVMDGQGQIFRVGGKVVKNAAGFDLAKFLVGSLGQYMIMLDVTFKIFPDKPAFETVKIEYPSLGEAINAIFFLNTQPYELDALDLVPVDSGFALIGRFAGNADTLTSQVKRCSDALRNNTALTATAQLDDAETWHSATHPPTDTLVKVPLSPRQLLALDKHITDLDRRYTVGGNIAWIHSDDYARLSPMLENLSLTGLQVLGKSGHPILGCPIQNVFSDKVKSVLDPHSKFPIFA